MAGLRAVKPVASPSRKIKMLLSGGAGAGKTWAALDFPQAFYIDTEGSLSLPEYAPKLASSGGMVLGIEQGSSDFKTVNEEIQTLATTDHDFKTVVIDSFTKMYMNSCAEAEKTLGNDYGKDKKEANKEARKFVNWVSKIDCNVCIVCHSKTLFLDEKEKKEKHNTTFDGYDKLDYELDLWIEIFQMKNGARKAVVRKSRLSQFATNAEFPWSFSEFAKRHGGQVFAKAEKFVPATAETVGEFETLFTKAGMSIDWREKMLTANKATTLSEVSDLKLKEYIEQMRKKVS